MQLSSLKKLHYAAHKYPSQCTVKDLLLSKRNYTMRLYCLLRIPSPRQVSLFASFHRISARSYFFLIDFFSMHLILTTNSPMYRKCIDTERSAKLHALFLLILPPFHALILQNHHARNVQLKHVISSIAHTKWNVKGKSWIAALGEDSLIQVHVHKIQRVYKYRYSSIKKKRCNTTTT